MANNISDDNNEADVLPESILSLSKDARYIQQCQDLLQKFLTSFLERKELIAAPLPSDQGRKLELQRVGKQITWMVSCLLYMLISARRGRTLGMETLGLAFMTVSDGSTKKEAQEIMRTRLRYSLFVGMSLFLTATSGLVSEFFSSEKSVESRDCNNQQTYQEGLRGRERRLIHERLRRQMLERAANLDGGSTSQFETPDQQVQQQDALGRENITISSGATSLSLSENFLSTFRQLSKVIFRVYSNSDGPHNIVRPGNNDDENNGEVNSSTSYSIVLWVVRLHLACFLLSGKYPTVIHRFLGLESMREKTMNGTTGTKRPRIAILDRPTTNRAIGTLILLQASATLVQNTSNWIAKKVANYMETRASVHQKTGDKNNKTEYTRAQLREKLDKFFGNNSRELLRQSNVVKGNSDTSLRISDKKSTTLCTICRLECKHVAVPSSCGHVCCWNCLIQWVSTVRPECPICRAPCSAKDVLLLHNYEPGL